MHLMAKLEIQAIKATNRILINPLSNLIPLKNMNTTNKVNKNKAQVAISRD
jgi:hypothetical protein